jgi:hypothetical protein
MEREDLYARARQKQARRLDIPGGDQPTVCDKQRAPEIQRSRQWAQAIKRTAAEKDARMGLKIESL